MKDGVLCKGPVCRQAHRCQGWSRHQMLRHVCSKSNSQYDERPHRYAVAGGQAGDALLPRETTSACELVSKHNRSACAMGEWMGLARDQVRSASIFVEIRSTDTADLDS